MGNTIFKKQYPYKNTDFMAFPFNEEFEVDEYGIAYPSILLATTPKDLYTWFEKLNAYDFINQTSLSTLAKTANLEVDNMQAPLGNCVLENNDIVEHVHHGSMGNYESLVTRNNQEHWTIVLMTNQKKQNVFELTELIRKEIESLGKK